MRVNYKRYGASGLPLLSPAEVRDLYIAIDTAMSRGLAMQIQDLADELERLYLRAGEEIPQPPLL